MKDSDFDADPMLSLDAMIDRLSDRFEAAWRNGENPRIEDYLTELQGQGRAELIRELLQIELQLRVAAGPRPTAEEYVARFPDDVDTVRSIFADGEAVTLPVKGQAAATVGDRLRYFGEYELLEEVARGGMGVVFKARQIKLNRIVALKMILSGHMAGAEEVQRFRMEAEAAANLNHPAIVPIYEIGEYNGQHFFSMGFVEGQSLADRIKQGPLSPLEAAATTSKIAEAIAFAHESGIVHRDLKPANVLLNVHDDPKVTDFGLAKQVESDSDLTKTGAVMGTPSYMSPEQASGNAKDVGPPTDVYSLGAILYHLLTGKPPFQSANPIDTLVQVRQQEPIAPRLLNANVPKDLETICLKCLEKSIARRYSSASDVADELVHVLRGEPIQARPIGYHARAYRWCRRNPAIACLGLGVLMLLVTTGVSGWLIAARETANAASQANLRYEAERRGYGSDMLLARQYYNEGRAQLVKDIIDQYRNRGDLRGFAWGYLNRLVDSSIALPGHKAAIQCVAFSPSGDRLATSSDNSVKLWDALKLNEVSTWNVPTTGTSPINFNPDGSQFATISANRPQVSIWEAATGRRLDTASGFGGELIGATFVRRDDAIGTPDNSAKIQFPSIWAILVQRGGQNPVPVTEQIRLHAISPNRTRFATIGRSPNANFGENDRRSINDGIATIWGAATGFRIRSQAVHDGPISNLTFGPNGYLLASGGLDRTVKIWDTRQTGSVISLTGHTDFITRVAFSSDGRLLASGDNNGTLLLWATQSGELKLTINIGSPIMGIAFGPRDSTLFTAGNDRKIQRWDAQTGEIQQTLVGHTGSLTSIAISPDGSRLASGGFDHSLRLWDIGTAEPLILADCKTPAFSTDETKLASVDRKGITIWNVASGLPITFLECRRASDVQFHPNGRLLAALVNEVSETGTKSFINIWDAATGTIVKKLGNAQPGRARCLAFNSTGNLIAVCVENVVNVWHIDNTKIVDTFRGDAKLLTRVQFSPDNAYVASASVDGTVQMWDLETKKLRLHLKGHRDIVTGLSFSPAGDHLATASADKTAKLWDVASGELLLTLKGHEWGVDNVSFNSNGRELATASYSSVKLWDTLTGRELLELEGHSDVSFSRSGMLLATHFKSSPRTSVAVWDARSWTPELRAKARARSLLSALYTDDSSF
ncbi:MAG: protein kinase, partial [Planctomycetales bacterium]|nr:protein kinase [Planctomycetales bacterium]